VRGPAPAPLAKLRGDYRYHVLLLAAESAPLPQTVTAATAKMKTPDGVRWIIDIDPTDML
ncbi:MAG: hypothetical protein AAGG46_05755, partial [Planctomycetota bacterium]